MLHSKKVIKAKKYYQNTSLNEDSILCEGCALEDFDNDKGGIYKLSLVYNKKEK